MEPRPLLILASCLLLCACAGDKAGTTGAQTGGSDTDFVNGTPLPERREGVSFLGSNVNRNQFKPVHFALDSSAIESGEMGRVQAVADYLKGVPNTVIIAGFTDERGTADYNRALGEKRAGAVRERLIADGVPADRVQTVSFGLEMPAAEGHDESAWAANRRAEFGVTR